MNQAQLRELYLNNNNIKSINRKMLQKMQKLEVLDLSYNRIGYVDPDAGIVQEFIESYGMTHTTLIKIRTTVLRS